MAAELTEIIALARSRHAGQTDALGRAYADAHLHPIAASLSRFGADAEAAGWLHDIVEDTGCTLEDLAGRGVPARVVAAVDAVTRRPGETYEDLITRSCADELGVIVKVADNNWNILCNPLLAAANPTRAARLLFDRYLPARRRLLESSVLSALDVHEIDLVQRNALRRLTA